MLSSASETVERIVEQAPVLDEFEVTEYIDGETNNAIIQFEKVFAEMDVTDHEDVLEKYNIRTEPLAEEIGCTVETGITTEIYYIQFIFEEWDLSE